MEQKRKILIVDDTMINRALLVDMLEPTYETIEASNGLEAVAILSRSSTDISLVLLDIVMPEMDGFEVLTLMNRNGWLESIPVIMISAEINANYIDHAYDLGATDYITRPFDEKTVQRRVNNTVMLYTKQQVLQELVMEQVMEKERNNSQMVEMLSNIVEFRNGESGLHVLHIRVITNLLLRALARSHPEYNLTVASIAMITSASALHDVGKISIDAAILNKPGRLTQEEYEIMKTHTTIGAHMLEQTSGSEDSDLLKTARDICRWHHERYDGRGYPDGLKGDEIPLTAQVVALADVYDALTSERVYKRAIPHDESIRMIVAGECGVFNPVLLDCLQENSERLRNEMQDCSATTVNNKEMQRLASDMLNSSGLQVSNRTLALLEQERMKYKFYASMSNEILFEYDCSTKLLEFTEWGAQSLHVPELIMDPAENEAIMAWGREAFEDMRRRVQKATPEHPDASGNYRLNIGEKGRWFRVILRTLWEDEEQDTRYSHIIGKLVDIHDEQLKLDQWQELASRDPLTALLNRRAAKEQIIRFLSENSGKSSLIAVLDLDYFKSVNDQHGHGFGDKILQCVAKNLQASIRRNDVAARIGGDEFLLFASSGGDLEQIVQRIFHALTVEYEGFQISISMGVAVCPKDAETYEELFRRADTALYEAKRRGKGQYCFYDESIPNFSETSRTPIDK